jgi:hypothetical protein
MWKEVQRCKINRKEDQKRKREKRKNANVSYVTLKEFFLKGIGGIKPACKCLRSFINETLQKPSSSFFPSTLVSLFHLYPFSHWTTKHAAAASTLLNAHQTRKIDRKFWKSKKKERMKLTHQHDGEERKKMRKKVIHMLIHTLRKTERYSLVKLRKREKQRERERERTCAHSR